MNSQAGVKSARRLPTKASDYPKTGIVCQEKLRGLGSVGWVEFVALIARWRTAVTASHHRQKSKAFDLADSIGISAATSPIHGVPVPAVDSTAAHTRLPADLDGPAESSLWQTASHHQAPQYKLSFPS